MAFKFVKSVSGENFPIMRKILNGATATDADIALTQTAGKAAVASGSTRPRFISCGAGPANGQVPVQPMTSHYVWETTFSASAASINEGDKVTLSADGAEVTATTASGVATVVAMFGTGVGSTVWVRFE